MRIMRTVFLLYLGVDSGDKVCGDPEEKTTSIHPLHLRTRVLQYRQHTSTKINFSIYHKNTF